MQKFLKILMKLFYILLFRQLGWLLSGDKVEVDSRQLGLVHAKRFSHPAAVPITSNAIAIFRADGKSDTWMGKLIPRRIENPVATYPFLRIFPELSKVFPLPDTESWREAQDFLHRTSATSCQFSP